MMRVLVTGGAGYIGSHTAKALAHAGFEPVVLDNMSLGHRWAVRWGPLIEADLADVEAIHRTIHEHKAEAVLHFAGSAYVAESVQNPRKYFQNNVVNTLHLLDAMLDTGVPRIIFSSSCVTYGIPDSIPIAESHRQKPISPYGETKLLVERTLRAYEEAYGLQWMALRYFNAAGADPDSVLGEHHDPETHLVPLALQAARKRIGHLEIYGIDYPTADGTAVRDYTHVTDLANAHVLALQRLIATGQSDALNLGTGHGTSVRQVVHAVQQVSGATVPISEAPRRAGDPPTLVADPSRARAVLGWEPELSDIHTIISTALQWMDTHGAAIDSKSLV